MTVIGVGLKVGASVGPVVLDCVELVVDESVAPVGHQRQYVVTPSACQRSLFWA